MRQYIKILIPILTAIIYCNCSNNSRICDSDIEIRANKIASCYDSTNIDIFRTWGFVNRGQAGIWFKNSGDSSLYSCIYRDFGNYSELKIMRQELFLKDFGINFQYDTAYWRINFIKQSNGFIKIIGVNNHGQDIVLIEKAPQDSIFKQIDPFFKFQQLTDLRDSLQFMGVHYYERLGGFIQFYLSPYHILTYIPSYDSLNPQFKQIWIKEFERGKLIKKHWNLRKLDKPIDNG